MKDLRKMQEGEWTKSGDLEIQFQGRVENEVGDRFIQVDVMNPETGDMEPEFIHESEL